MPTNNKLSLNNRGAIFALRGEGYSLGEIGCKLVTKRKAEKIAWKNLISIPPEYLNLLYESMPSQIEAMVDLGVPICKSCFDWTVTVGQQSRAKITSFSVFIFSKFTWEAFFF